MATTLATAVAPTAAQAQALYDAAAGVLAVRAVQPARTDSPVLAGANVA